MITNANFENTPLEFLTFRNSFSDYTSDWYLVVGKQIQRTMFIQSMMPYIQLTIMLTKKLILRFKDSKFTLFDEFPKTKKITIQQYVDLYSGPDVVVHFRYSSICNMTYVAFTHGLALPLLFPITLFGIINIYLCERVLFAYFYRQPPMFDNLLNDRALSILMFAPLFMVMFSYWMIGNRQMFYNECSEKHH